MIDTILSPPFKRAHENSSRGQAGNGDRPLKSLLKTISWRVVGTIDTITISWLITGEIKAALSIGSVEVVSKMILYYLHERAWAQSSNRRKEAKI